MSKKKSSTQTTSIAQQSNSTTQQPSPTPPFTQWLKPLRIDEGLRAAICMLPMLVAFLLGQISLMVPLGQGGFYYSSLPLSKKRV